LTRVIHRRLTLVTHIMAKHFHDYAIGDAAGREVRASGMAQGVRCEGGGQAGLQKERFEDAAGDQEAAELIGEDQVLVLPS
jgi:hypothetical protein